MPFVNGSWIDPTEDDIANVTESILNPKSSKKPSPTNEDIQSTITNVMDEVIDQTSKAVNYEINSRVYKQNQAISKLTGKRVDIILPVYNAIHLTEECIRILYERTAWPFDLYVVDDGSDHMTKKILGKLQKRFNFNLITNKKNHGFAAAVNRGVKAGSNHYICLLNSDVLVTDGWLTKMLIAMEDDQRNQIVNPATNNTAPPNPINMYPGYNYQAMNKVFEAYSKRAYPEIMPTGFLYLIKRELFKKLGYFSPNCVQFGEETASWMSTVTYTEGTIYPHYRAVLADDTYVFHQRSVSFSSLGDGETSKLRQVAAAKFHKAWPQYKQVASKIGMSDVIKNLKEPAPVDHLNFIHKSNYKICWLVHSVKMCGGMKYIADIVNEINERGGDARVALVKRREDVDVAAIAELRTTPIVFESYQDVISNFTSKCFNDGIVVASTVELAPVVSQITNNEPNLKPLLHVQSYEPDMVDDVVMKQAMEAQFSLIPNIIVSSNWVSKKLEEDHKLNVTASIPPGIDNLLFYPKNRELGDDRPTVMIMMRKGYHFKGYNRGIALIKTINYIADKNNLDIRILAVGVDDLPEAPEAICLGELSQVRLADQLGKEVDVFIDPSSIHSYGLPALEALASGCTIVSWDNKGINEYLTTEKNGVIFDKDASVADVAKRTVELLIDPTTRKELTKTRGDTIRVHDRRKSVSKFIQSVQKTFGICDPKKIFIVTPHLRKHGGPTTILDIAVGLKEAGHQVMVGTTYSDIELDVIKNCPIPIHLLDLAKLKLPEQVELLESRIPECDILISNSDNPLNPYFMKSGKAKKKIMLKLSHNGRFRQLEEIGLNQNWDAILTTSDWLKDTCINQTSKWNYTPHPEEKVFKIGWSHYSHDIMNFEPVSRDYTVLGDKPIVINTLIHNHPSKGTLDAFKIMDALYKHFGNNIRFFGVGEVPKEQLNINLRNFDYVQSPSRTGLAELFKNTDIWLGASHTEGLGRMALEAMSASVACVISDTQPEYGKSGENCLLFPVGDLQKAAEYIGTLISNVDLRRNISIKGYETAMIASQKRTDVIRNINKAISYVE